MTTPATQTVTQKPAAKPAAPKHAATAAHVQFSDIGMDAVVLKDGSARAVIEVTPLCLEFHSDLERSQLTQRYAAFLNSLESPLQVLLKSRQLDIEGYLSGLKVREETEERPFFKGQLKDYRELLEKFLPYSGYGIMRRQVFIVVAYELDKSAGAPTEGGDPLTNFLSLFTPGKIMRESRAHRERQQKLREGLTVEVNKLLASLETLGVSAHRLTTLELLHLFARTFHPATRDTEHAALFEQFDAMAHPTTS